MPKNSYYLVKVANLITFKELSGPAVSNNGCFWKNSILVTLPL